MWFCYCRVALIAVQGRTGSSFQGDRIIYEAFGNTCGIHGMLVFFYFAGSLYSRLRSLKLHWSMVKGMHLWPFPEGLRKLALSTLPQAPLERLRDGPCLHSGER